MEMPYKEFALRRLHSLTGLAPLGLFLFEHFFTNSYSYQGEAVYNHKVDFLRTLPYLPFIEWGLLFGPFLFHMLYGFYIIYTGQVNVQNHSHPRNWTYFLMRVAAFPAFAFIVYHVVSTRFMHGSDPDANLYRLMVDKFENPIMVLFYIVGILCVCFHFAIGISTFCITWGLTITPRSQQVVGAAAAGIGVVLALMAINSIFGFTKEGLDAAHQGAEHAAAMADQVLRPFITKVIG